MTFIISPLAYRRTINYLSGNVLQLKTLSGTLIPIDRVIYRGVIVLVSIEAESSRVSLHIAVQIEPSQGSAHRNPRRAARRNFVVRLMTVAITDRRYYSRDSAVSRRTGHAGFSRGSFLTRGWKKLVQNILARLHRPLIKTWRVRC